MKGTRGNKRDVDAQKVDEHHHLTELLTPFMFQRTNWVEELLILYLKYFFFKI